MTTQQDILESIDSLQTLSSSVARLAAMLGDETMGASDYEQVIRPDPALTANILRLANAASFAPRSQLVSVSHAVAWLGTHRLFELCTGVAFAAVLPDRLPGYDIDAQTFWTHSVAVGTIAENLAKDLKLDIPDLIFTAGLLHDIGKLVISAYVQKTGQELRSRIAEGNATLIEVEQSLFGIDHAKVGGALALRWSLPLPLAQAARWHHAPSKAPKGIDQLLLDLVAVADGLAHSLGFGADVGELWRSVDEDVCHRLNIKVGQLELVASECLEEIERLRTVFSGEV